MRVLLLTWDYPPAKGGIQVWMSELARRLPDAHVTVLAPAAPGDAGADAASGARVRRLRALRWGRLAWFLELGLVTMAQALFRRPDLIVCGHVITGPAALLTRWTLGVPYVVFTYAWEIRRRRRSRLVSAVLRRARLVIAISAFTRAAALQQGVASHRIRLLHPGVDASRFAGDGAVGAAGATLLTVSRLDELHKGHDTAIRALPLVRARVPNVRYVIVGDGRLRDYLARLARSVGVEDYVVFAGAVSDDALPAFYRDCAVYVQPSREAGSGGGAEGFGIVCLEAAAAGRPVVAGRSGGLPDAVVDGVTGILVDPHALAAIANALVSLLQDRVLAARLGSAGRARVLERFTWDDMAARARRIFAEAAEGEPRASSS